MRKSHLTPFRGTRITVHKDLLSELGIDDGSLLYALPMMSEPEPTIILSIIPPVIWSRAYKLVINLSKEPGTLANAARVVSDLNINLVTSWSAATTASGEGTWTSIVELPAETDEKQLTNLRKDIVKRLVELNVLSKSEEFKKGLMSVRLVPLRVLQNLTNLSSAEQQYIGSIEDFSINLEKFFNSNGGTLFDYILNNRFLNLGLQKSLYCLLTPDTEERYSRLSFFPTQSKIVYLSMDISILSKNGIFKGYFGESLASLASIGMNLFTANNTQLAKKKPIEVGGGEVPSELARFEFVADIRSCIDHNNTKLLEQRAFDDVLGRLQEHAQILGDSLVEVARNKFIVRDLEILFPKCFLATNARAGQMGGEFAFRLSKSLRALKFDPVNVDITKTRDLYSEVTALLNACPILVSLHLPHPDNELVHAASEPKGFYAPSDWVLFEESYMLAKNRKVFRMRHESVRQPRFSLGQREYTFTDDNFDPALKELEKAMQAYTVTNDFEQRLAESEEALNGSPQDILRRDVEEEYMPTD